MAEIKALDVQDALTRIARENVNTAEAVRHQLVKIFDKAIAEGIRESNPVRSEEIVVPKRRKRASGEGDARHQRILNDLPRLLHAMEKSSHRPALMLQLRFSLLTLTNPKECRYATWPQIDMEAGVWRFQFTRDRVPERVRKTIGPGIGPGRTYQPLLHS